MSLTQCCTNSIFERRKDAFAVLRRHADFRYSKRMYTRRLREWNVAKNIVSHDVQEYLQRSKNPTELTSHYGSSSVMLRGRMVTERKLLNHMKRRKIIHEAEPNQANVDDEDSLRTRNTSSEDKDESHANLCDTMDEVPYQDCEKILGKDEMSIDLTSDELTSLSIAILQTDFHYRGNDEDTSPEIASSTEKQVPQPLLALSPSQVLAGPPELCDLAFILHYSNVAYAQFPNTRNPPSPQQVRLAARQQSQAKDMYARHWLAGSLCSRGALWKYIDPLCPNNRQLKPILSKHHPHFLPWIAFVVYYTGSSISRGISDIVFHRTLNLSKEILPDNDPRRQILKCLLASKFRRSICLVLLRQVISTFQNELQSSHINSLDLLARLFDMIGTYEILDGDLVEETLRRWAESSLAIANVIKEEKRTTQMKAEWDTFNPVHQAEASNSNGNSNTSFGQDQWLFAGN
jgi:hypothetical protein